MSLSSLVNAPRLLRERNTKAISGALVELRRIEDLNHSAIRFQFDRQSAGSLELTAWRQSWAQSLQAIGDVYTMSEKDVVGCGAYRRSERATHPTNECIKSSGEEILAM